MEEIRYIHAADLHLDAPFYNMAKGDAALAGRVQDATFKVLDRLTALCLAQKPDFLLLAGDIIHQDGVRARLRLRDACETLNNAGIAVFMVHGNHDPASAAIPAISWPANTIVFGPGGATAPVTKNGETIALVHGASHATAQEGRNLAALIRRNGDFNGFQAGLLHCNVDGAVAADRYAPCTLQDLKNADLDAWHLGHAHTRNILCRQPFIAYAGNTQGLHANETGSRGCFLMTASKEGGQWHCEAEFHELDAVRWQRDFITMDNIETLDAMDSEINIRMMEAMKGLGDACTGILTLEVSGRTPPHGQLMAMDIMGELGREPLYDNGKSIWLTRLKLDTAPPIDPEDNLDRDDLLGEISRLVQRLEGDEAALAAMAAQAAAPIVNACRQTLPPQTDAERKELLAQARRICQDMLEGR